MHGLWWVAEAPDRKVSGTLTYSSTSGIRLALSADPLEHLEMDFAQRELRWHRQQSVILGNSDDGSEHFTVIDAVAISISSNILLSADGVPTQTSGAILFLANHVLRGQYSVPNAQAATFSMLYLEVDHLEAWAGGPALAQATEGTDPFHPRTLFTFQTETGHYELTAWAVPFFRERESGTSHTCAVLARWSNPVTLQGLMGELEKLLSLLTLLFGVRACPRVLSVHEHADTEPLELIALFTKKHDSNPTHWDMSMPLCNLAERASAVFSNWFAEWHLLSHTVAMLLTACSTPYATTGFLLLANAVEAFHRATQDDNLLPDEDFQRWRETLIAALPSGLPSKLREKLVGDIDHANECNFRARLKVLLFEVLKLPKSGTLPSSGTHPKNFIAFVVNARNSLTHAKRDPQPGPDLIPASQDLTAILVQLLLMRIGCADDSIRSAMLRLPRTHLARGLSQ